MTTDDLTGALRACASGLYPLEAGTELLISDGTFVRRGDFTTRFITCGTSGGTLMPAIDWDAAITALNSGGLPCSGGERRILQLSASLAAGNPCQPPRHRHRPRRPQHRATGHRNPARGRKTTRERGPQQFSPV
jgi:hypothetical protein